MTDNLSTADDESSVRRYLSLRGSPNFRDAGGYTCQGGSVNWGQIFRSGHLADLDAQEKMRVAALELDLVIDLRRADERGWEPTSLDPEPAFIHADITPGSQRSAIYSDSTQLGGAGSMYEFMCDINREFVDSQTAVFRDVLEQLLASDAERILVHCSAGKDRTGFLIAMLHLALEVDRGDVEQDYLLSRRYYRPQDHLARVRTKYPVEHLTDEDLLPMMQTDVAYLHAALAAIDARFDGIENYLQAGLGIGPVERAELKRRFVT